MEVTQISFFEENKPKLVVEIVGEFKTFCRGCGAKHMVGDKRLINTIVRCLECVIS